MKRIPVVVLVAAFIAGLGVQTNAYVLLPTKWKIAKVTMQMQMGSAAVALTDNAGTWNKATTAGLTVWNPYIKATQFATVQNSSAPKKNGPSGGFKHNNVFFASNYFGNSFGSSTLAVCAYWYNAGATLEADVVFNTKYKWDSYRGPLKSKIDIRRVAIHEFGHALGLGHSTAASAIMRAFVGNLDKLAADDIAGAQKIYGKR